MIEAIFIQSYYKELADGRLFDLIDRILRSSVTGINIYVFLDELTYKPEYYNKLVGMSSVVNFIIIDDLNVINPTTRIFHFLMNYKTKEYKRVLVLESDCILLHGFDKSINEKLSQLPGNKWFIYGSRYYGNTSLQDDPNKDHMNGVAVYNRTDEFLSHLNQVFVNRGLEQIKTNYDFAYYESIKHMYQSKCVDSELILNISDPKDIKLRHENIKPASVIIHTKCTNYTTNGAATECLALSLDNSLQPPPTEYCRKIPVFVHVPKCAGTYAVSVMFRLMINYCELHKWNHSDLMHVCVLNDRGLVIATLLVHDLNGDSTNNKQFRTVKAKSSIKEILLSDLLEGFNNNWKFFVFAISVESSGVDLIKSKLFEIICKTNDASPMFFAVLRECFSKTISFFNYLKSDNSSHERKRRKIISNNFNEYIMSSEMQDSWLIRKLVGVADEVEISQSHVDSAISILDEYTISNISHIDNLLNFVFSYCYNLTYSLADKIFATISKNSNNTLAEIKFADLSQETQTVFLERTKWDRLIYNKYCKESSTIKLLTTTSKTSLEV